MLTNVVNKDSVNISWQNSVDLENPLETGKTQTLGIKYQLQMAVDQNYNLNSIIPSIISVKYCVLVTKSN